VDPSRGLSRWLTVFVIAVGITVVSLLATLVMLVLR
jgi:hypothetical protein